MSKVGKQKTEAQAIPEDLVQVFSACGNFPKDREGVLALAQALKRASDDFHVSMADIVRDCSDSSSWCPTPHDIREVARQMRDDAKKAPLGCEVCQGSGFRSYKKIVSPAGVDPYEADYATFCDCERGRWMRQCERERKAEAEGKQKGKFRGNDNRQTA